MEYGQGKYAFCRRNQHRETGCVHSEEDMLPNSVIDNIRCEMGVWKSAH